MRWFNMLEIKQLNVSFGKKTLFKDASFCAECGHLTVIKGRSGSGKSTFLKSFQFAYDCIYLYEGERIDTLDEENKQKFIYNHLANVHQIPLFIEGMTIGSHIKQLEKLGCKRIPDYEEQLGIKPLENKYPKSLSGGEKTRAAVYLALIRQPEILILDEPTAALDAGYAQTMIHILKEYADKGHYVISASHDSRMIQAADTLYKVEGALIIDRDLSKEKNLIKAPILKDKNMDIRFSHRTFRTVMNILIAFTMIICAYSYNIYGTYSASYEDKINSVASRDLVVYKEKYKNDYYTYYSGKTPLSQQDYNKIKSVSHIERLTWRYDVHYSTFSEWTDDMNGATENNYDQISLSDGHMNGSSSIFMLQTYDSRDDYTNITIKHADNKGVYLSSEKMEAFLEENNLRLEDINIKKLKIGLWVPIPVYNASGISQMGTSSDGDEWVDINTPCVKLVYMNLPVRGILKPGSAISTNSVGTGNPYVYIPRDCIAPHMETFKAKESVVVYSIEDPHSEKGCVTFENVLPSKYTTNDVTDIIMKTPWRPDAYTLRVDNLKNINQVKNELERLGFRVEGAFVDNDAINSLINNNQKVLIEFIAVVFILLYGFYFYLKYLILREEKQTRDYLYNMGLTTKRIDHSFYRTYLKNALILGTFVWILLEVIMIFTIKMMIIPLIMPITKIHIALFYTSSFVIEFFIPVSIQKMISKHNIR